MAFGLSPRAAGAAEERRYALVVGANRGDAGEPELQYAVEDARRIGEILRDLGGFAAEDVVTLEDPSADALRSTLARVNARIRQDQEGQKVRQGLLLVYYSGHADAFALHLGGTRLPWEELRNLTSGSSAEARLLVVDACRSGSATRVKGTRLGEPFALPASAEAVPEGFAIISSAAAGESAQESEALEGSFFTHHFLSALLGGGDSDGDGRVGLGEAYRYAADRTTASTASTLGGVQHPTYAFELRGRGDLVLTRPGASASRGRVELTAPGVYLFRKKGPEGPLSAEVSVEGDGARPVALSLPPDRYFVSRRTPLSLQEGVLQVPALSSTRLAEGDLRPAALTTVGRKGKVGTELSSALAFGPVFSGPGHYGRGRVLRVDLTRKDGPLALDLVAGWGHRSARAGSAVGTTTPILSSTLDDFHLLGGARLVARAGHLDLSFGLRGGLSLVRQSFDLGSLSLLLTPARLRLAPLAEAMARVEVPLPRGLFLRGDVMLDWTFVPWSSAQDQAARSRSDARDGLAGGLSFGAGVEF